MKSKNGFTLVEALIVIAIIGIFALLFMGGLKEQKKRRDFGRVFDRPTIGQIYMVTAFDKSVGFLPIGHLVIAMPYKAPGDKEPTINDRRVVLKVKNRYLCQVGTWFITSNDESENIISSPLSGTTNTLESSFNQ